jgi:ergothioneine biosynthesis protein EgtB
LGLRRDSQSFGWDNEFEAHTVHVPEFAIDRYKVTNGQFLRFLEEGGYRDRALWPAAGWEWKTACEISHPVFWVRRGDRWAYRSMFDEIPLPPDWPVYTSHAEASAYARWASKALPTEAQWHRAAYGTDGEDERPYPPPPSGAWDPAPVNALTPGGSAFGIEGSIANGWEWTSTEFAPFPGFRPFAGYPGYSAQFFDGKHYVLKGGSVRTASCMLRRSFRNWFQPHYQYVYAGFRCASE